MPDITLEGFKANLKDAARPNRFLVTMAVPVAGQASAEELSFTIKAASIPGRTIGEVPLNWMGMVAKLAGDPTFEPWTVTCLNDYEFKARKAIEGWMELMANAETNERTDQSVYKIDLKVQQLGRKGDVIATYNMKGSYPATMDQVELSMDSVDTPEEFGVTFNYDYFVTEKAS